MGVRRLLLVFGLLCIGFALAREGYGIYQSSASLSSAARQRAIDEAKAEAHGVMTIHVNNEPDRSATLIIAGLGIACVLVSFVPGLRVPSAGE